MPLVNRFPPKAKEVRKILRSEVPRPSPPKLILRFGNPRTKYLRFYRKYKSDRFAWGNSHSGRTFTQCCPMGLHPHSTHPTPAGGRGFARGRLSTVEVEAFADWWDKQNDPKAAVDEVWGKK